MLRKPSIEIEARSGAEFRAIPVTGSEAVKFIVKQFQELWSERRESVLFEA